MQGNFDVGKILCFSKLTNEMLQEIVAKTGTFKGTQRINISLVYGDHLVHVVLGLLINFNCITHCHRPHRIAV